MIRILIPMGGDAKQFVERGYVFPKPLVEILGKPMVEVVVQNLRPREEHEFVFVCREEHLKRYALGEVLSLIVPNHQLVVMRHPTAGALCSALLAAEFLNNDDELLICNADQVVDFNISDFIGAARSGEWDGYIVSFPSTHPKWSYAKLEGDQVVSVVEKRPVSRHATSGIYYFKRASDFLVAAERMLMKSATTLNEFYLAPVYQELILMGRRIGLFSIERNQMHGLGTPEELEQYVKSQVTVC